MATAQQDILNRYSKVAVIGAGVIGAVLGTLGGYHARKGLVAAIRGRDLPIALLEDAIAILGGFAILAATAHL